MSVEKVNAQTFAFRNNLLYDATLTPNLGFDARLDSKWTAGAVLGLNAWDIDKEKNKKWRHLLVAPNVRRWLGDSLFHKSYIEGDLIYSHYNVGNTKIPLPSVANMAIAGSWVVPGASRPRPVLPLATPGIRNMSVPTAAPTSVRAIASSSSRS